MPRIMPFFKRLFLIVIERRQFMRELALSRVTSMLVYRPWPRPIPRYNYWEVDLVGGVILNRGIRALDSGVRKARLWNLEERFNSLSTSS